MKQIYVGLDNGHAAAKVAPVVGVVDDVDAVCVVQLVGCCLKLEQRVRWAAWNEFVAFLTKPDSQNPPTLCLSVFFNPQWPGLPTLLHLSFIELRVSRSTI